MSKTRDVLPIGSTTFLRLQQSSDDQSRHVFFVFVFMFFKPAGDPSTATFFVLYCICIVHVFVVGNSKDTVFSKRSHCKKENKK